MQDDIQIRSTSPDGRYIVRTASWEARASLWVDSPELLDAVSNESLLRFADPHWSLYRTQWQDATVVVLYLRKYPGNHVPPIVETVIDCRRRTATLGADEGIALCDLERALEDHLAVRKGP